MLPDFEHDDQTYARLREAVDNNLSTEHYHMSLTGKDAVMMVMAWDQGIDSHLEALTTRSTAQVVQDQYIKRLEVEVHRQELPVLIRRLVDLGEPEAEQLVSDILTSLDIDLLE